MTRALRHEITRERYYEARIARWSCSCGWTTEWVAVDGREHEAASTAMLIHTSAGGLIWTACSPR